MKLDLRRFFDLVFGSPRITPTKDENAMFMAFSASLRSGDLSRQVGAVVTTEDGTLLADGANDAPKFEGGQYWPGPHDRRDIVQESDANERIKQEMVRAILEEFAAVEPGVDPWFIEPYPKSRALELHGDTITLGAEPDKVAFMPFVGVGPRRYVDLFALRTRFGNPASRKDGRLMTWDAKSALPALRDPLVTYLEREARAEAELGRATGKTPEPDAA